MNIYIPFGIAGGRAGQTHHSAIAEIRREDRGSKWVTFVVLFEFVIRYRHFDLPVALHIATVRKISCASAQCFIFFVHRS